MRCRLSASWGPVTCIVFGLTNQFLFLRRQNRELSPIYTVRWRCKENKIAKTVVTESENYKNKQVLCEQYKFYISSVLSILLQNFECSKSLSPFSANKQWNITFSGVISQLPVNTWKYIVRFWQAFSQWVSLNRVMWLLNCNNDIDCVSVTFSVLPLSTGSPEWISNNVANKYRIGSEFLSQ